MRYLILIIACLFLSSFNPTIEEVKQGHKVIDNADIVISLRVDEVFKSGAILYTSQASFKDANEENILIFFSILEHMCETKPHKVHHFSPEPQKPSDEIFKQKSKKI